MSVRVDQNNRLRIPEVFQPGQEYTHEQPASGVVVLRLQMPADVPTVEPRRKAGRMTGAAVDLDPARVAAAVSADRDER